VQIVNWPKKLPRNFLRNKKTGLTIGVGHFRGLHSRLAAYIGDKGGLSLYGQEANEHATFSEHIVSDARQRQLPTLLH